MLIIAMQRKFYLDTAIWRDYFENRSDGLRPLGEFAFQFLKRCGKRKDFVIVSSAVRKELLDYYSKEMARNVFSSFKNTIIEIDYSKEQADETFTFWIDHKKKFPLYDVLHSILARDNCAVVIARDRHFEEIGIAECCLPEEVP